ncbi:hypothetical protein [Chamaesiphon minutus]|uniref:hypothetical protein n=1 Tax=Chamaesiphon minutus TaxID=1173032 RepID=UPI0003134D91|nr:hypothetical protein [Chamaesiphon minutus]
MEIDRIYEAYYIYILDIEENFCLRSWQIAQSIGVYGQYSYRRKLAIEQKLIHDRQGRRHLS